MEIENLEKDNNLEMGNNLKNENEQKNFLETTLGNTINNAIDIGIRVLLPDFIDEQIINIKDNLLEYGLKEGISKTIDDAIELGKSTIGIFTGNFENISQMQNAVQSGGLIDGISILLDTIVDKVSESGLINNNIAETIKQGKDVILNNVESNIEKEFTKQYEAIKEIDNYISNWKENFGRQDFDAMEIAYQKLEKQMEKIAPITKTIKEVNNIEILHNLIKNNGRNFNLSNEQLELVKKFN